MVSHWRAATPDSSSSDRWQRCTAALTQYDVHSLPAVVPDRACVFLHGLTSVTAARSIINCFSRGRRASGMAPRVTTNIATVALISIRQKRAGWKWGERRGGEVHAKLNWLRQVTEVWLLREGQEDKQQERLAEKRRAAAWKRSELTTGRGDGSIGASPGALTEMEWARLCWVLLNSLQRSSEGPD